jgi:hypothetical protein
VKGAALKTEAGNVVVVATGEAWRLAPDALLFGGPLHLDASYLKPPDPVRGPGWGIGAALVVSRHGYGLGPAVAAPPLRLLGLQLDASGGVTLGSGGEWAATTTVIGRRAP